jgi:hypothetical protein
MLCTQDRINDGDNFRMKRHVLAIVMCTVLLSGCAGAILSSRFELPAVIEEGFEAVYLQYDEQCRRVALGQELNPSLEVATDAFLVVDAALKGALAGSAIGHLADQHVESYAAVGGLVSGMAVLFSGIAQRRARQRKAAIRVLATCMAVYGERTGGWAILEH